MLDSSCIDVTVITVFGRAIDPSDQKGMNGTQSEVKKNDPWNSGDLAST